MVASSKPSEDDLDDATRLLLRKRVRQLRVAAAVRRRRVAAALQEFESGQGPQGSKPQFVHFVRVWTLQSVSNAFV